MVIEGERPSEVRVVRADSTRVVVKHPEIAGDTLTGRVKDARVAFPVSDVAYLQVRRPQPLPVIAAIAIVVDAGLLILLAATWD
jgi:hypothetical protein